MKKLIKFVDVKNFFDYDSIPEYWTVLNICY